jgi:hypothetical protein
MPKKVSHPVERKPRTDAQGNRERILEVARRAFTRSGANASLDDIAKEAEVGAEYLSPLSYAIRTDRLFWMLLCSSCVPLLEAAGEHEWPPGPPY